MKVDNQMVLAVGENEARVNVTWANQNGELPDPVLLDTSNSDVIRMVEEAIRGGGVPGIPADSDVDLDDFEVRRYEPTDVRPYNLIMIRPKTPLGESR